MGSTFSPVWLSLVLPSSLPYHWPNLWLPFIPPRIATSEPHQWSSWALSSCNYQVVPILSNLSHSADVWQSQPPPNCHQINEDTHLVLLTLGKWWYVKCNEEIVWSDVFYTYPAPNSKGINHVKAVLNQVVMMTISHIQVAPSLCHTGSLLDVHEYLSRASLPSISPGIISIKMRRSWFIREFIMAQLRDWI